MGTKRYLSLRRHVQRVTSVLGIVALSVIITVLTMRALSPQPAHAQQGQVGVVRASEFDLVGPDGTVLARLQPGGNGNGLLALFDTAGNEGASIAGDGAIKAFDTDGKTLRFEAGYRPETRFVPGVGGGPVNGVLLGPNGTLGVLPASP